MRRLLSICLLFAALRAEALIDVSLQMQLGNPSNASADTNNHDHYLIQRPVEAIDYSDNLGEPVWASWDLTASDVGDSGRNSSFYPDTNLPANFYKVTPDDYNGVGSIGFARGHLCPSDDRTDTTNDNKMVFLMSNIIPQDALNNSGVWGQFEGYCRSLAQSNELLIICGPSGFDGTRLNTNGPVFIPACVWKIAVIVPSGEGTALSRITSATRVIALKIPNTDAATNQWPAYVTSASEIETDTGFTFFTALPPDIAAVLRDKVDGQVASTLAGWDMSALIGGSGNYGASPFAPVTNDLNLTVVGLTRGNGVGTSGSAAGQAWGGVNFTNATAADAITASKFITFSVTPNPGYQAFFASLSQFNYRRSGTGPPNGLLQYQVGSGTFTDIANLAYPATSGVVGATDLTGITALQRVGTKVTFRLVNYGGTNPGGSWYVSDVSGGAVLDLTLQGTVTAIALPMLSIQQTNTAIILSWPVSATGFALQQNSDLTTANWLAVTNEVNSIGNENQITLPASSGNSYFRLIRPQ